MIVFFGKKRKNRNMNTCCNTTTEKKISSKISASATVHCLTGCAIGEFFGLFLGGIFGLSVFTTVTVAIVLSFVSGFLLSLVPLIFGQKMSLSSAIQSIWLGEILSISAMELAMNIADYYIGGVGTYFSNPLFWAGYGIALVAGFLAAWPVNHWMISKNIKKKCH